MSRFLINLNTGRYLQEKIRYDYPNYEMRHFTVSLKVFHPVYVLTLPLIPWLQSNVRKCLRYASKLKRHVHLMHGWRETPVECSRTWCNEQFHVLFDMEKHRDDCYLHCPICAKKYTRMDKFTGHERFHLSWNKRQI